MIQQSPNSYSPLGMCSRNSTSKGAKSFKQNQNVGILPIISTILNSKKTLPPTTKTTIQRISRRKTFILSFLTTLLFYFCPQLLSLHHPKKYNHTRNKNKTTTKHIIVVALPQITSNSIE
jgi:hypothetical protein